MPLPRARSRSNDRNARRRTRSRSRRRSRSRSRRREARNHSRSGSRSRSRRREARSRSRRRSRSRTKRREARNHSRSGSRRSSGRSYGERKEGRHEDNRGNPVENQIRKENRKGSGRHDLGASFERRFNKKYANEELSNGRLPSEFRKRKKEYNDMKIMRFAWKKRRNHLKRVQYDDASRPDSYAYPDKSSKHSRSEEKPRGASSADGRFHSSSKRVEKQRSTRIQQSQNSMHQRQSPLNNAASGQPSTHNVNVPYVSPGNSDLSCTSPPRHHLGKSDGIISTGLEGSEAPTTSSEHSTSTRNQSLTNERVEPATQPRSISMGSSYDAPGYNGVPREPAMSQRMDSLYGHPGHSSSSSTLSNGQDQSGHMYDSYGSTRSGTSSSYPFQTLPESIQDFHEDQRQSPVNNEASRKPAMSQWRDPLYFHPGHSSSSSTFFNGQDQSGHMYDSYGSTRSGTSSSYPTETLPENTQHFPGSRGALETSSNSWKHATDALDQNDVYPSRPRSKEEEEKSEQYKIFRAESELLDNRFKLLETKLGEGKYGIVFGGKVKKTEPLETERFVAIKEFNNEQDALRGTNSGKILVSLREIEMMKKLPKHKNIVEFIAPCHRLENDITSVFLVMEFVNSTLAEEISDFHPDRLSNEMIQSRMKDLLTGLQQLHAMNIIHRDIKPPNLLIDHNGCLKICDFGISIYDTNGNKTPQMMTRYYKPPEVLEGSKSYSKKVDMWSAGCVFGEMFKTDALFLAKNDKELREMIEEMIGNEGEEQPPELMRNIEHPLPDDAFQLLKDLLKRNPARRINAIDALRHEYFTNELTYN